MTYKHFLAHAARMGLTVYQPYSRLRTRIYGPAPKQPAGSIYRAGKQWRAAYKDQGRLYPTRVAAAIWLGGVILADARQSHQKERAR